ncbi:acyltransferase [Turicibacter sanguinis]|uniref:acyltransferase n=1 Tax=Turicibacter sanguinis TaxID=154288 RepID=UPI0029439D16|nr:acyltransferase [Turicibacter sanguinis]
MNRGRNSFYKIKPIIDILTKVIEKLPLKVKKNFFELLRMKRGKIGLLLRYVLLKSLSPNIGDNVYIAPGSYILNPEYLEIGNNVSIHPMCYIESKGGIYIGDNVSIAHNVTIMSETHIYKDINIPIKDQGMEYKKTTIESNVWIGAKATILAGNSIGEGSIIGAGSVVTKNVIQNCIVAGVPAKVIKSRI